MNLNECFILNKKKENRKIERGEFITPPRPTGRRSNKTISLLIFSYLGSSSYRDSWNSFIFSLVNRYNLPPFKSNVYRYNRHSIYTSSSYGPTFGGGHDIYIANNARFSTSSYSNFGYTYRPPYGYSYGSSNTRSLLAGSYNFKPTEVEVFYVN